MPLTESEIKRNPPSDGPIMGSVFVDALCDAKVIRREDNVVSCDLEASYDNLMILVVRRYLTEEELDRCLDALRASRKGGQKSRSTDGGVSPDHKGSTSHESTS